MYNRCYIIRSLLFVLSLFPDRLSMASLSKLVVLAAGAVLGSEVLWRLACVWRRRLKRNAPQEVVEVLFFPDLPSELFQSAHTRNTKEELVQGTHMFKEHPSFYFDGPFLY